MKEIKLKTRTLILVTVTALFVMPTETIMLAAQELNTKHHHYKVIDVGTLGGPGTWLSYPPPGELQINQRGLVVGISETATPDPNTPNCITPDCDVAHAFQWQNGVLADLGSLPGGDDSTLPRESEFRGAAFLCRHHQFDFRILPQFEKGEN